MITITSWKLLVLVVGGIFLLVPVGTAALIVFLHRRGKSRDDIDVSR